MTRVVPYDPRNHDRRGWTKQCVNRDRQIWPYAHLLSDQHHNLIIETIHTDRHSLQMEVQASGSRIKKGEPNLGGQVPTRVDVMGVPAAVWRGWLGE